MTTNKTRWLVVGLVIVLVAGLVSEYLWLRTSLPKTTGTVTLAGLDSLVEVVRDANGVPHIFAESPKDWHRLAQCKEGSYGCQS